MKGTRVCTDFSAKEFEALQAMCHADFRLPDDEIRYLVVATAKQRGLLPNNSEGGNREAASYELATSPTTVVPG